MCDPRPLTYPNAPIVHDHQTALKYLLTKGGEKVKHVDQVLWACTTLSIQPKKLPFIKSHITSLMPYTRLNAQYAIRILASSTPDRNAAVAVMEIALGKAVNDDGISLCPINSPTLIRHNKHFFILFECLPDRV
jgi:hypothetical protein